MKRCSYCAARLTTKTDICTPCRLVQNDDNPGPEHALTDGAWVNDHGIQRWVPAA